MSVPNLITLGRLLSVPIIIWLVLSDNLVPAFFLFLAAGLSDAVDGFIAKRFDQRSALGALLDPVADKAMLVSLFVTLGIALHLPDWLVILVVFRDIMIIGGFLLGAALSQSMRWEPLVISKVNTGLQITLVAFTLARLSFNLPDYGISFAMTYIVATTTLWSGAAYLVRWARALAGAEISP